LVEPHVDLPSLAVDLPGRPHEGGGRSRLQPSLADHASAVLDQVLAAGFHRVILVGHSMAGLVIPEVAARASKTVERLVFVSCVIPPESGRLIDVAPLWLRWLVVRRLHRNPDFAFPRFVARWMYCNGVDPETGERILRQLVPEPLGRLAFEEISRRGLPSTLPRTYVKLSSDRALPSSVQDRMIDNLGGAEVVTLDAGHEVMLSQPRALARMINELCRARV
jgi:pimeloyl-ACP methyl ester carboxylesterase